MRALLIEHPDLGKNKLVLKISSFLGSPKLFYNDIQVSRTKKTYSISEKLGKPFDIQLKNNAFDLVPKVIINNEQIEIVTPLKWYEYIWMGLPILLIFQGGPLSGLFGFLAFKANRSIFRSERKIIEKYLFTLGLNISVTVAFVFLAMVITNAVQGS